jgi:hypothetical protein
MIWAIPFAAMGLIKIGLLSAIEVARVNIFSGMMSAFEPHHSMRGIKKRNHHWRIEFNSGPSARDNTSDIDDNIYSKLLWKKCQ